MTLTTQTTKNVTQGVHHVGLTVPNLTDTAAFFIDVLGYDQVGERPEYPAVFVSDGWMLITLWQASDPHTATSFDRKNVVGLHHLAIAVVNQEALESLHTQLLASPGVHIEFAPEQLGTSSRHHMMCNIPGGIRIEFNAPGIEH